MADAVDKRVVARAWVVAHLGRHVQLFGSWFGFGDGGSIRKW